MNWCSVWYETAQGKEWQLWSSEDLNKALCLGDQKIIEAHGLANTEQFHIIPKEQPTQHICVNGEHFPLTEEGAYLAGSTRALMERQGTLPVPCYCKGVISPVGADRPDLEPEYRRGWYEAYER